MGALSKLTGKPPPLRVGTLERLQQNLRWDSSRAQETLSVAFRPLEETLRDTVHWFSQKPSPGGAPAAEAGGRPAGLNRASA
jgi:hypothetical protein